MVHALIDLVFPYYIILYIFFQICIRYSTFEAKEEAHIGYNGFLFLHEYSGEGRGAYAEKETCYIQYRQLFWFP